MDMSSVRSLLSVARAAAAAAAVADVDEDGAHPREATEEVDAFGNVLELFVVDADGTLVVARVVDVVSCMDSERDRGTPPARPV